jgi:hypothetical protein
MVMPTVVRVEFPNSVEPFIAMVTVVAAATPVPVAAQLLERRRCGSKVLIRRGWGIFDPGRRHRRGHIDAQAAP